MTVETITGVGILGGLLRDNADLIALAPAAQIKAGKLPDGTPLPALLLRTVSSIELQYLKGGTKKRLVDRVSVTVRAETYRQQQKLIALIQSIGASQIGDIGGAEKVAIRTAGTGPDLNGPGNSFEQSQDFRVTFVTQA